MATSLAVASRRAVALAASKLSRDNGGRSRTPGGPDRAHQRVGYFARTVRLGPVHLFPGQLRQLVAVHAVEFVTAGAGRLGDADFFCAAAASRRAASLAAASRGAASLAAASSGLLLSLRGLVVVDSHRAASLAAVDFGRPTCVVGQPSGRQAKRPYGRRESASLADRGTRHENTRARKAE
jgi:hypothetical protein